MCSDQGHTPLRVRGFPIRTSTDRSLIGSSPWLIAAFHVLHRHQAPRHPPLALHSLEISLQKDARACYRILKERAKEHQVLLANETEEGPGNPELTSRDRNLRSMVTSWEARVTSDRLGVCHDMWQLSLERR
jgi:hypothetical protein